MRWVCRFVVTPMRNLCDLGGSDGFRWMTVATGTPHLVEVTPLVGCRGTARQLFFVQPCGARTMERYLLVLGRIASQSFDDLVVERKRAKATRRT